MATEAMSPPPLSVLPLGGMPLFEAGLCVAGEIVAAAARQRLVLADGDIVVVAQKIVSKAEGRTRRLRDVSAGPEAIALAAELGRPAALVQLILDESFEVMRATSAVIVVRHRSGHVLANAGIDASNVGAGPDDAVLLWPVDPDASAAAIRARLHGLTGATVGVIVADSMGRAWRLGTVGTAIGAIGLAIVDDRRGERDLFRRTLQATQVAVADSLAAAAVLVMGEGAEGVPAAVVRGAARHVSADRREGMATGLRPIVEDLFR